MVVIGFTNGIAILIASTQIKDFFGCAPAPCPANFCPHEVAGGSFRQPQPGGAGNWAGTLAILLALAAHYQARSGIDCRGGGLHRGVLPVSSAGGDDREQVWRDSARLPPFALPDFHSEHILPLIPSAFTVALLAALESMLSAVVADGMTGDRHNPNVELVAQGVANMCRPCSAAFRLPAPLRARPRTSAPARARPVAGMVHALTLLGILLVAAPLASYIPLATLAAVLFVVAYNMGEWNEIGGIFQLDFTAISVWLVTFALTVFADLTVAVAVGMSLAALLYIYGLPTPRP
jgi:SulP family sulfate permease